MDDPSSSAPSAPDSSSSDRADRPSPGIYDLLTMGMSSAVMIGLATAAGVAIDDWLHSSPWATLGGLLFGLVAGTGNIYFNIRKYL